MSSSAKFFLGLIALLSLTGLFFVFEASTVESFKLFGHQYYFFRQQAVWLLLSFFTLLLVSKIKVSFFEKYALHFYVLAILLLVLTLIPGIGLKLNGARRWIALPFGTLQTVELFKFVLINFYAYLLSKKMDLKSFLFFLLWPAILILLQPDFGSLMIIAASSIIIYFLAGGEVKLLSLLLGGGFFLALLVVLFSPYRRDRLMTFLNPEQNTLSESYHVRQITLA
jgi:cell division protein FtsW